jgi:hypothetical protein
VVLRVGAAGLCYQEQERQFHQAQRGCFIGRLYQEQVRREQVCSEQAHPEQHRLLLWPPGPKTRGSTRVTPTRHYPTTRASALRRLNASHALNKPEITPSHRGASLRCFLSALAEHGAAIPVAGHCAGSSSALCCAALRWNMHQCLTLTMCPDHDWGSKCGEAIDATTPCLMHHCLPTAHCPLPSSHALRTVLQTPIILTRSSLLQSRPSHLPFPPFPLARCCNRLISHATCA